MSKRRGAKKNAISGPGIPRDGNKEFTYRFAAGVADARPIFNGKCAQA